MNDENDDDGNNDNDNANETITWHCGNKYINESNKVSLKLCLALYIIYRVQWTREGAEISTVVKLKKKNHLHN